MTISIIEYPSSSGSGGSSTPDWTNIIDLGADNTGVADVSGIINIAAALGKPVYFPAGTYLISTLVVLPDNAVLIGDGRKQSFIKLATNVTAFQCGFKNQITGLEFTGTNGSGGNSAQRGILIDGVNGCLIDNVGFYFLAGYSITIINTALIPQFTFGNQVVNCYGETNGGGVLLGVRGEYNTVSNNTFVDGTEGIHINGGNNRVVGNNLPSNGYGIRLGTGANDGHGTAVGNTMNHCAYGVYSDGVTLGFTFSANHIYSNTLADVFINNSVNIAFEGGDIDGNPNAIINITNSTNCHFKFVKFPHTPVWTVGGTSSGAILTATNGGISIGNINYPTKSTEISDSDGVIYYGGDVTGTPSPNIQQHYFRQTIRGANDISVDFSRDFIGGSARFDGTSSSPGDMFQVYRTGTTGSAFTVLDNGANYLLRALPTGAIIIGGTTNNASAKVQIDSTTQGFLPPRVTTVQKNAIATPTAGLIVYDTTLNKLCVYTTAWEIITSI